MYVYSAMRYTAFGLAEINFHTKQENLNILPELRQLNPT
jgi:hypothetical protein